MLVQHQPDGALSRRRPARGDLPDRAADRRRGARARRRSARAAAQEHDPGVGAALQERRSGVTYDCGEFAKNMDDGAEARRRGRLRGAPGGVAEARQAARPRASSIAIEQAAGPPARIRRDPLQPERHARRCSWARKNQGQGHETMFKQILHERLGIDPRDVQLHRRRHRPRRLRHGHQRLALDGDRRHGAVDGGRQGDREGQQDRRATCSRRPSTTWSSPTASFTVAGTDRAVALKEVARAAFQPAQLPPGFEAGLYETGTFMRRAGHLSQRLPRLRGRDRSRDRRRRRSTATPWSTTSAR